MGVLSIDDLRTGGDVVAEEPNEMDVPVAATEVEALEARGGRGVSLETVTEP